MPDRNCRGAAGRACGALVLCLAWGEAEADRWTLRGEDGFGPGTFFGTEVDSLGGLSLTSLRGANLALGVTGRSGENSLSGSRSVTDGSTDTEWRFNNRNNPHVFRDAVKRSSRAIRYATESWSTRRPPAFSLRQSIQAARPGLTRLGPLEGPRREPTVCLRPLIETPIVLILANPEPIAQLPRSGSRSTPRSWPFQSGIRLYHSL